MFIPRYWHRIDSEAQSPKGKRVFFSCSRGSSLSLADAVRLTTEMAQRIAARIHNGDGFPQRYAYGDRPLKEQVVEAFPSQLDGQLEAAITRNAYGSLVLNTARVCFIDVDLPLSRFGQTLDALFQWLRGRGWPRPDEQLAKLLDRLRSWVTDHPEWSVRAYRTNAGLRYLVTHTPFSALDQEIEMAMQFLGADPHYVRLCRVQKSYRARLTPKPWRCYIERPRVTFPWKDSKDETIMREWESRYNDAGNEYATCELIETVGQAPVHPQIAQWVTIHDKYTRVGSGLPLA